MMKKLAILCTVAVLLLLSTLPVSAKTPYTTWSFGPGDTLIMTQSAYEPLVEIDLDIDGAQDFVMTDDGILYIADTGNHRIVKVENGQITAEYGNEVLEGPTGLTLDEAGNFYIADGASNTIVILDPQGALIRSFGKPDEPLFGQTNEFLPRKIAIDVRKNLYIIGEGSNDGIIQMNTDGDFVGYFGANLAQMSLKMIIQRLFLTKEQLAQFIKNEAPSPVNIAIDQRGLVYTVTGGSDTSRTIRKFNIAGNNVLGATYGTNSTRDIHVAQDGIMVTVNSEGLIIEYDINGSILFFFDASDLGDQRLGSLKSPSAVLRYEDRLYVLDSSKNAIVVYQETAFAKLMHEGVKLYTEGLYLEAQPYFESLINANGSFLLSYMALGNAAYQRREFDSALSYFRLGESRYWYSQAFWELRNVFIQNTLGYGLLGLVGYMILRRILRAWDKAKRIFDPIRKGIAWLTSIRWINDVLFIGHFIKHPLDGYYRIKQNERGSLGVALGIFGWVILVRLLSLMLTGFIFNPYGSIYEIRIENEITLSVGLIVLFIAANYLIASISEGEGRLRQVIIGTAYSLMPLALLILPITLISNGLTLNEQFIYELINQIMWGWTVLLLFIMIKEIHNFTFTENVRVTLLTIFTMILMVLVMYILYFLFNQLYEFVYSIWQEVRVRG
jgi:DNA-binding beta-propeller fold protein YncE